jgi:protocatechuate 3,4-dioxygenase alpha subunit
VGPYYTIGLCRRPDNELVDPSASDAVRLAGTVFDGEGAPIVDAMVEAWDAAAGRWGRSGTDAHGRFELVVAKPAASPPDAPRLDVYVFARGLLRHQLTRVYFPDETAANEADPVLGALSAEERETLVAQAEDGGLRFDVRMQGERATVFFAL